jgi:hypothetical protein
MDSGSDALVVEAGADATGGKEVVYDVVADGISCLTSIPAGCPDCKTQNSSDEPICQQYLQCFIKNDCNPSTACGDNTGICGVNTVGGGEAPYTAAVATYNCACP